MDIIVIGSGTVGAAVCMQLSHEGHDVTVIDRDGDAVAEISNVCDVAGIVGNGADVSVLRRAGAEKADLLIAIAAEDEINILCCTAARKLGTRHTIARVRNPAYAELMQLMGADMNLSMTINPELAAAQEIYRILRFPTAAKIETFCRGRMELAEFTATAGSPLCGVTLNDLRARLNITFLVCCVLREGTPYIPSGDFTIQPGDIVCVTAPENAIARFFKALDMYRQPVRDVLIVGGGRTTYYLEEMLEKGKIRSTVVEKNRALCHALAERFDCTVVCDSGTSQELLLEEGIEQADAFLALTDVDEENAIVSMYARTRHVNKVVTMISTMSYVELFKDVGLESIVSPKASAATQILRYARAMVASRDSEIESLHRLMDDRVEALEFVVKDEIPGVTGIPLKSLHPRHGVLIACILQGENVIIPTGDDCIRPGDTVVVLTTGGQMNSIKDII